MKTGNGKHDGRLFVFGPFTLDPGQRHLLRGGEPVAIPPKAFDTLVALVENRGRAVRKDELLEAVWPDAFVEENNVNQYVSLLRKALGDEKRYIETVPRWGFRFVADVEETSAHSEDVTPDESASAAVRDEAADEPPAPARPRTGLVRGLVAAMAIVAAVAVAIPYVWSTARRTAPAALPEIRSVAVLPFTTLGIEAPDEDYLRVGMADALINRLGRLRRISVRPTSAVQRYASSAQDPVAVGNSLGVDAVLEGRIQKAGDRIRVTVQLVGVRNHAVLWTQQFDEEVANIFAVQDAVALRVMRDLAPGLTDREDAQLARRPTESPEAYDAYMKGRYFWNKRTTEGLRTSIEWFQKAIDKDPSFALAYAGLADAYSIDDAPKAEQAIRKALELDDTIGEAHASLGFYLMFHHWNWGAAEQEFKLAVELSPNYATAHQWYAIYLAVRGRLDEAKAEMTKALEIDPRSPNVNADLGQILYFAGDYDGAIAACRRALEIDPDFLFAHQYLVDAFARKGMYDEAAAAYIGVLKVEGRRPELIASVREIYATSGWEGVCRKRLEPVMGESVTTKAAFYLQIGDRERALAQLQKALDEHDFFMIFVEADPVFAPLRSDPRFVEIARRVGRDAGAGPGAATPDPARLTAS